MLIDWFTVIAQVLNFLILVGLLRYFLYQPILDAIDQREKHIAAELATAETQKSEAKQERASFQKKNAQFEQERAERLKAVEAESQQARKKGLDAARQAAADLKAKHQISLQREQAHLHQTIQRKTAQEVFAIARKTLRDLADAPLEAQMVAAFLRRLSDLAPAEKQGLQAAVQATSEPVRVQTGFALSEVLSAQILKAVQTALGSETEVNFDTSEDLINGIELSTQGQKLAWSISDYLSAMEARLDPLFTVAEEGPVNA
jgi:F-type H+-transporting ATPase subunit b